MCIDKAGLTNDVIDLAVTQVLPIPVVDTFNILLTRLDQGRPVKPVEADVKTVAGHITQGIGKVGTKPHDLFRDTTDVDTGPA